MRRANWVVAMEPARSLPTPTHRSAVPSDEVSQSHARGNQSTNRNTRKLLEIFEDNLSVRYFG